MKVYKLNNINKFNNCKHFNSEIRILIIGTTGRGKTNLLFNLLLDTCPLHKIPYLDYDKLILVSPTLQQENYQLLIKCYQAKLHREQINNLFGVKPYERSEFKNEFTYSEAGYSSKVMDKEIKRFSEENDEKENINNIEIIIYDDPSKIPEPKELFEKTKKVLVIIDDSVLLSQEQVKLIYTHGRPLGINIIFLSQSFKKLEKSTIRAQSNFIFLFSTTEDLKDIYEEQFRTNFKNKKEFENYCYEGWKAVENECGFISLNKETNEITQNFNLVVDNKQKFLDFGLINNMDGGNLTIEQNNLKQQKAYKSNKLLQNKIKEDRQITKGMLDTSSKIFEPITKKQEQESNLLLQTLGKNPEKLRELELNKPHIGEIKSLELAKIPIITIAKSPEQLKEIWEIMVEKQNDDIFGITLHEDGSYRFGVETIFDNNIYNKSAKEKLKYLQAYHKIELQYDLEKVKCTRGGDNLSVDLTEDLMGFLTQKDLVDNHNDNAKRDYVALLKLAIGPEMKILKNCTNSTPRRALLEKFRQSQKYIDIVQGVGGFTVGKGFSYKELVGHPIIIPEDPDEQTKRLFILLGSVKAGTHNDEMLKEYSMILDQLYKNNKITKPMYKLFYYNFKALCERHK